MKKYSIINIKGEKVKDITLNEAVWGIKPNDSVLYEAITLARNSLRQGTHSTKTRGEVRGGGRKPWRQKGTGHARQGSIRSPQWTGGGIVFGPKPKLYTKKMNKKERVLALKSALSYKEQESGIIILDSFIPETNKTKDMLNILKTIKADKNILIVVDELTDNIILGTRNIPKVNLLVAAEINTLDVISADSLVITENAVKAIEEVLG